MRQSFSPGEHHNPSSPGLPKLLHLPALPTLPCTGLFHSYLILEQFAKVSPRAATAFRWVATVFTAVFVTVRRWASSGGDVHVLGCWHD